MNTRKFYQCELSYRKCLRDLVCATGSVTRYPALSVAARTYRFCGLVSHWRVASPRLPLDRLPYYSKDQDAILAWRVIHSMSVSASIRIEINSLLVPTWLAHSARPMCAWPTFRDTIRSLCLRWFTGPMYALSA
jgi:hypothetical protein